MANIARLGVVLGLDSAEFVKGIETANKKLLEFGRAIEQHKGAISATFSALIYKALEYADGVSDIAKANDIAIDSVIKLQNALANSGGEAENAGKLLSSFTNFVDKAADGSLDAQKAFAKAGVSLKDLGSLDTQSLFEKTVSGIAGIADPLTRSAKAMDVFGKAAKNVDFVGLNQEIQTNTELTKQQAQAIADAGEVFDFLSQLARNFAKDMAIEFGPALKTAADYFKSTTSEVNIFTSALRITLETLLILGANVSFVFKAIGREIGGIAAQAAAVATLNFSRAFEIRKEMIADAEKERKDLDDFEKRVLRVPGESSIGVGGKKPSLVTRTIKPAKDPEIEARKKLLAEGYVRGLEQLEELRRSGEEDIGKYNSIRQKILIDETLRQQTSEIQLQRKQDLFKLEIRSLEMRKEDVKLERDLIEIQNEYADNMAAIQRKNDMAYEDRLKLEENELKIMTNATQMARERYEIEKSLSSGSFMEGFFKGAREFVVNIPTDMQQGQQAFVSMMQSMDAAISNFVKTGKLNFKDLARNIISDLIAIQIKMQAMQLFKFLYKGVPGLFSSSSVPMVGDFPVSSNIAMAANGGYINGPTIVGERGPELFIPNSSNSGNVIPNHRLGDSFGNTPSVVYNGPYIASMTAIDTQSATQFLARNKLAVWSANQSASRSLPASR